MKWVTKAPVYVVTDAEFKVYAQAFMTDLKSWQVKGKRDETQKQWNAQIEKILNEADVYGAPGLKVVYKLAEGAAALMRITELSDSVKIEDLAAHVGAKGGGEILVEWAVDYAQQSGKQGVVTLTDMAPEGYYKALGFEYEAAPKMKLVPGDKPAIWTRLEGEWKLAKYIGPDGSKSQFLDSVT